MQKQQYLGDYEKLGGRTKREEENLYTTDLPHTDLKQITYAYEV